MLKKILIITMMFNLAFSQGRLSGALGGVKDKLKKIEKEIKDNAALLSINTPSNFDGYRFDMNKVFNIQKIKENTFQSMTKNQNRSKSGWMFFATMDDITVANLKSDWSQSLKSKKFGKRVYTRGYNFDLVKAADEKTSCECESFTEVKGRLLYWKWFSKYTDYLECEIVTHDGEKSILIMEYSTYKEKLPLTKRIASKLLPESLRDNGQRTKIAGKLKSGSKQYDVSSTYEYDLAFLGDKSPMSLIQPPVGYYISSSTSGEYFAVKDPSKFRISKNINTSTEAAKYYASLLATYFYYPHSKDFIALGGKKGLFGYRKLTGRMNDHFYDAKFRGAFGLF